MYFDTPVKINEVTATAVKRIKYSPDYFTFGDVQHDKDTVKDLGFAGFKALHPLTAKIKTMKSSACSGPAISARLVQVRFMAFCPRPGNLYRLAIGEQFPRFKEFWI